MQHSYKIFLRDLHINAIIGVFPEERKAPQALRVNIELQVAKNKNLADDYSKVPCYKLLCEEIEILTIKLQPQLLESLAEEIAKLCLRHEVIMSAKIDIEKPQALDGKAIPAVQVYLDNL